MTLASVARVDTEFKSRNNAIGPNVNPLISLNEAYFGSWSGLFGNCRTLAFHWPGHNKQSESGAEIS
jgi:hypothetical protein